MSHKAPGMDLTDMLAQAFLGAMQDLTVDDEKKKRPKKKRRKGGPSGVEHDPNDKTVEEFIEMIEEGVEIAPLPVIEAAEMSCLMFFVAYVPAMLDKEEYSRERQMSIFDSGWNKYKVGFGELLHQYGSSEDMDVVGSRIRDRYETMFVKAPARSQAYTNVRAGSQVPLSEAFSRSKEKIRNILPTLGEKELGYRALLAVLGESWAFSEAQPDSPGNRIDVWIDMLKEWVGEAVSSADIDGAEPPSAPFSSEAVLGNLVRAFLNLAMVQSAIGKGKLPEDTQEQLETFLAAAEQVVRAKADLYYFMETAREAIPDWNPDLSTFNAVPLLAPSSETESQREFTPAEPSDHAVGGATHLPALPVSTEGLPDHIIGISRIPETDGEVDGTSIWIASVGTKKLLSSIPGFPRPLPAAAHPTKCEIRPTTDMGFGVFATRDIKRFEVIFVERPYLVIPVNHISLIPEDDHKAALAVPEGPEWDRELYRLTEATLKRAFSRMTAEDQREFMSMAIPDDDAPILGIMKTNGFRIPFRIGDVDKEFAHGYGTVGRLVARINHSCVTDVTVRWDTASFSFKVLAVRDIKAGSEIFMSYVPCTLLKAQRQVELAKRGFECKCRVCVNWTPTSDKLRAFMNKMVPVWKERAREWVRDPNLKESTLDLMLTKKKEMEDEGLDTFESGYYEVLSILAVVYGHLGMGEKAERYSEIVEASRRPWVQV